MKHLKEEGYFPVVKLLNLKGFEYRMAVGYQRKRIECYRNLRFVLGLK